MSKAKPILIIPGSLFVIFAVVHFARIWVWPFNTALCPRRFQGQSYDPANPSYLDGLRVVAAAGNR